MFFDAERRECHCNPVAHNGFPAVNENNDNAWCGCGRPRQLEVAPTETVVENVEAAPAPEPESAPIEYYFGTREEIMADLDRLGVKYYRRDSRATLKKRLKEATGAV